MKFKELLTKIVSGIVSEEEKNIFWDCIDNDDDLAEILCKSQIPRIMALICENEFIKKKPYFREYGLVCSLYESNMDISNISFDLEQLKTCISPFLTPGHINILIQQLQLREDAIQTIMDAKDQLKSELATLDEKIKSHQARSKQQAGTEKTTPSKKKAPTKLEEHYDVLKKRLSGLQDQERLLVSTYKRPEQMLVFLKGIRETQLQSIKTRENVLLANQSAKLSFEIGQEQVSSDEEYIQGLLVEIEKLKKEKEEIRSGLNNLLSEKKARILELEKICGNLKIDKEHFERESATATSRLIQLEPRLKQLEAQVREYDQILLTLNGRMYEILHEPLRELETSYFNLNDFQNPLDPKEIASYFVDAIGKLRDGINNIPLNVSKVKILDKEYSISLHACAEFEDWADRKPIDFDPEKHILMRGKAKQVHVITRGFSYTNNLGNIEVIKAEVRSAEGENDEQGGTK